MNGGPRPIRLLIVDDHPVVREGLTALLARQPGMAVVGEAANGEQALALARSLRPDVVVLDLRLPGLSGAAAVAALRAEVPESRVVVLSYFDGGEEIYRALRAGASAYLLKGASREELVAAVREVQAGGRRVSEAVAARLAERIAGDELTSRELEVLRLLVGGHSNKAIASALGITEGTVKAHVGKILAKLHVDDRTQAATAALRRGIVILEPPR